MRVLGFAVTMAVVGLGLAGCETDRHRHHRHHHHHWHRGPVLVEPQRGWHHQPAGRPPWPARPDRPDRRS